jgi:hypothetical protein
MPFFVPFSFVSSPFVSSDEEFDFFPGRRSRKSAPLDPYEAEIRRRIAIEQEQRRQAELQAARQAELEHRQRAYEQEIARRFRAEQQRKQAALAAIQRERQRIRQLRQAQQAATFRSPYVCLGFSSPYEREEEDQEVHQDLIDPFSALFGIPLSHCSPSSCNSRQSQPTKESNENSSQVQQKKSEVTHDYEQTKEKKQNQTKNESSAVPSPVSDSSLVHYPSVSGHSFITRRRLAHSSGRSTPSSSSSIDYDKSEILSTADAETHALKEKKLQSNEDEELVDEEIEIESASSSDSEEEQKQVLEEEQEIKVNENQTIELESSHSLSSESHILPPVDSSLSSPRSSGIGSPYSMLESSRSESQVSEHEDLVIPIDNLVQENEQEEIKADQQEVKAQEEIQTSNLVQQNSDITPLASPEASSSPSVAQSSSSPFFSSLTSSPDSYEYLISVGTLSKTSISLDISHETRDLTLSSLSTPIFSVHLPSDADLQRPITAKYIPIQETNNQKENQLKIRVARKETISIDSAVQIPIF